MPSANTPSGSRTSNQEQFRAMQAMLSEQRRRETRPQQPRQTRNDAQQTATSTERSVSSDRHLYNIQLESIHSRNRRRLVQAASEAEDADPQTSTSAEQPTNNVPAVSISAALQSLDSPPLNLAATLAYSSPEARIPEDGAPRRDGSEDWQRPSDEPETSEDEVDAANTSFLRSPPAPLSPTLRVDPQDEWRAQNAEAAAAEAELVELLHSEATAVENAGPHLRTTIYQYTLSMPSATTIRNGESPALQNARRRLRRAIAAVDPEFARAFAHSSALDRQATEPFSNPALAASTNYEADDEVVFSSERRRLRYASLASEGAGVDATDIDRRYWATSGPGSDRSDTTNRLGTSQLQLATSFARSLDLSSPADSRRQTRLAYDRPQYTSTRRASERRRGRSDLDDRPTGNSSTYSDLPSLLQPSYTFISPQEADFAALESTLRGGTLPPNDDRPRYSQYRQSTRPVSVASSLPPAPLGPYRNSAGVRDYQAELDAIYQEAGVRLESGHSGYVGRSIYTDTQLPSHHHNMTTSSASTRPPANRKSDDRERVIKYLADLRYSPTVEDSLDLAYEAGLITDADVERMSTGSLSILNIVLDVDHLLPPAPTSWLTSGMVFMGTQHATPVGLGYLSGNYLYGTSSTPPYLQRASPRVTSRSSGTQTYLDANDPTQSGRRINSGLEQLPRRVSPTSRTDLPIAHSSYPPSWVHMDNWPVKVTIHEVNYDTMKLSATMEAFNVPSQPIDLSATGGDPHPLYSADDLSAAAVNAARVNRELRKRKTASITTFLEGELLDFQDTYTLLTESFTSFPSNDATYWSKLEPFASALRGERSPHTTRSHSTAAQYGADGWEAGKDESPHGDGDEDDGEDFNPTAHVPSASGYGRQRRSEKVLTLSDLLLSRKWMHKMTNEWILMRWKEKCFVKTTVNNSATALSSNDADSAPRNESISEPSSGTTTTTTTNNTATFAFVPSASGNGAGTDPGEEGEGCGLTISGFYYVALRRRDGLLDGLYCDPQSAPYQHLRLAPQKGTGLQSWEFK